MNLSNNYVAVGTASDEDNAPCVVVVSKGNYVMSLPEHAARKLADDILRNANYLWPVEKKK
jgi:hypothetical protein